MPVHSCCCGISKWCQQELRIAAHDVAAATADSTHLRRTVSLSVPAPEVGLSPAPEVAAAEAAAEAEEEAASACDKFLIHENILCLSLIKFTRINDDSLFAASFKKIRRAPALHTIVTVVSDS